MLTPSHDLRRQVSAEFAFDWAGNAEQGHDEVVTEPSGDLAGPGKPHRSGTVECGANLQTGAAARVGGESPLALLEGHPVEEVLDVGATQRRRQLAVIRSQSQALLQPSQTPDL